MKFYIKPENYREAEIWDSGWRCGLFVGLFCGILIFIISIQFVN